MWRVKNLIAYGMLLLLVFAAYVYLCDYYLFLLLLFLVFLLFFSVALVNYMAKSLSAIIVHRETQAAKNVEQFIEFQVENRGIVPVLYAELLLTVQNLFYEKEVIKLKCFVPAKMKKKIVLPVTFQRNGCVEIGVFKIVVRDWLQVCRKECSSDCREEFMIMPATDENDLLQNIYSNTGEDENNHNASMEQSDSIAGIRDYRNGDRMQRIHWKLSAKREKLLVKEYESIEKEEVKILLELECDEGDRLDACLDVAYALIKAFLAWQQPICLMWWSTQQEQFAEWNVKNEEMLEQAMYALFYEQPYEGKNQAYFIRRQSGQGGSYFYIQPYSREREYYGEMILVYEDRAVVTEVS